jgi:hypothetical protein
VFTYTIISHINIKGLTKSPPSWAGFFVKDHETCCTQSVFDNNPDIEVPVFLVEAEVFPSIDKLDDLLDPLVESLNRYGRNY